MCGAVSAIEACIPAFRRHVTEDQRSVLLLVTIEDMALSRWRRSWEHQWTA
jgi:hypothetical protein